MRICELSSDVVSSDLHTVIGVIDGVRQRAAAQPHCCGSNQDALWVQAMQYVFETLAFFPYAVLNRNAQAIDEQHIGVDRFAAHFFDFTHFYFCSIQIGVERSEEHKSELTSLMRKSSAVYCWTKNKNSKQYTHFIQKQYT